PEHHTPHPFGHLRKHVREALSPRLYPHVCHMIHHKESLSHAHSPSMMLHADSRSFSSTFISLTPKVFLRATLTSDSLMRIATPSAVISSASSCCGVTTRIIARFPPFLDFLMAITPFPPLRWRGKSLTSLSFP